MQAYNQGRLRPLAQVDELLAWAKQSIERSAPLQNILETVLLQLL